ncbi:uncharacterized protein J2858_000019 [Neorhizobium galegae]|uniref:lysozyme inhibitor LprI family protein n=1 Tax=Neorhizobium galegae TaxID=399 RepID=UPI003D7C1BE7|nr:uncharacterized protein [Neorhizobium galegae]
MKTNRLAHTLAAGAVALMGFAALPAAPAFAASFDCQKADLSGGEKVICEDRSLNDLDVKMATTFDILTSLMAMGNRDQLKETQLAWLKKRQECGADAACIRAAYEERMTQLNEATKTLIRPL